MENIPYIYRGLKLRQGDKLRIFICEKGKNNANNVIVEGVIVFYDAAFCLEYKHNITGEICKQPLCNYANYCKIEKL